MSARPAVALFASSFNPPGVHHRQVAQLLAERFDSVLIVPYGSRDERPETLDTPNLARAAMVDRTFRDIPGVLVDLFDLERDEFTPTIDLEFRYADAGELWHVLPAEFFAGARAKRSVVHGWEHGEQLFARCRFAVLHLPGQAPAAEDLPPTHRLISIPRWEPADAIRSRIFQGQSIDGFLLPDVADYILRHRLYRGVMPPRETHLRIGEPRLQIVFDDRNAKSRELAATFRHLEHPDPNIILVIGGDGTMLQAIRQHWRKRVPIYGCNAGHLGHLLNDRSAGKFWERDLITYQFPMLHVAMEFADHSMRDGVAFGDAWVERARGQAAWIRLRIGGIDRITKVVADGLLVATAAGSSAYARAMGATPVPINAPTLVLAGSNVFKPDFWKPMILPLDTYVEFYDEDDSGTAKRSLRAYLDGIEYGEDKQVKWMGIRTSRIAGVEIAFDPAFDPSQKLLKSLFPPTAAG